jgi:hypothetical protein
MTKKLGILALALACVAFAFVIADPLKADITTDGDVACKSLKVGNIEADTITIRSTNGKASLTITRWNDGVGIFSGHKDSKELVCIVHQGCQSPYIGLNDTRATGCPIAMTLDHGLPMIQVREEYVRENDDGEKRTAHRVRFINANGLLSLATPR